jgi:hypothetical protein
MLPIGEDLQMTSRRPKDTAKLVDQTPTVESAPTAVSMSPPTLTVSGDASGRLALVLAGFALAVATFLIILVAIAASNA